MCLLQAHRECSHRSITPNPQYLVSGLDHHYVRQPSAGSTAIRNKQSKRHSVVRSVINITNTSINPPLPAPTPLTIPQHTPIRPH